MLVNGSGGPPCKQPFVPWIAMQGFAQAGRVVVTVGLSPMFVNVADAAE